MANIIQYANQHWVKFKKLVILREKDAYENKKMSSVLVQCSSKCRLGVLCE